MTKGEIIGQTLLRLSGGRPTTDMSIRYGDVASLIAPCVNYLNTKQYYLEKREEDGDKSINPLMLQTYDDVKVEYDEKRERYYSTLPAQPITLPSGRSIDFIGSLKGKGFIPMSHQDVDLDRYYKCFKKEVHSYLLEGNKVYYYNIPPLIKEVLVKMIVNANNLKDEDEVVVPSGMEPELLNLIYELLTGQRELKNDDINDSQDHNK